MGAVWRGTDTRLNRVVAIKLLHAGLSGNDRFRARFHQEAQAVAQLQSPGIVSLYDYGEEHAPEGLVSYLIMELVRGQALDTVLRQRARLSPNETLKIMASAAEALDVAHQAHIIHRDIKPGNLLVDADGSVKIVDFGIAAAKGGAGLTETGTVMGTLAYASPEQLQGTQLTGATDVYSLGIVAYECLSGRPPFAGNEPTAAIAGHLTGQPAPLPPDVPAPIAQIVMRCLAKDPRQRFASAAELGRVCRAGGMGGGTTAILSPGSPSPQSTQVMTPGMAPAMGAGIVQAHTSVQPVQQGGYASGASTGQYGASTGQYGAGSPPERTLPPPREPEEPKRNPTGPILVVAAGLAVLLVTMLLWHPWNRDKDPSSAGDGVTTAGSPADEAVDESSDGGDEATSEDDSGNDDSNNDDEQEEDTSEDNEETTEEEPELYTVPDLYGMYAPDAIGELESYGVTDIQAEYFYPDGEEAATCTVSDQFPAAGEERSVEDTVVITYDYAEADSDCPDLG